MTVKKILAVVLSSAALVACGPQGGDSSAVTLDTEKQKASYALGVSLGGGIRRNLGEMDVDAFMAGMSDNLKDAELRMSNEEMLAAIETFQNSQMEEQEAAMAEQSESNKQASAAFMAENGSKDGVVTLESGLQYEILQQGDGPKPAVTDTVEVHYRGTLIDGTEFDSSYSRGATASFPLNSVIPGWTEALQLMPVGSKWRLAIPSNLAYGPSGAGGVIGPNAALIFEVELIAIGEG